MDRLHNKPARSFSSEQDSRDSTYMAHSGGLDDQHERRRPASRQSLAQVLQASDSIAGQTEGLSAFTGVPSKPKSGEETSANVPGELFAGATDYGFHFQDNSEAINAASGLDSHPTPNLATTENSSVGASTPENRRGPNTPGSCCLQAPLVKSESLTSLEQVARKNSLPAQLSGNQTVISSSSVPSYNVSQRSLTLQHSCQSLAPQHSGGHTLAHQQSRHATPDIAYVYSCGIDQMGLPENPKSANKPFKNVRKKLKKFKSASKILNNQDETSAANSDIGHVRPQVITQTKCFAVEHETHLTGEPQQVTHNQAKVEKGSLLDRAKKRLTSSSQSHSIESERGSFAKVTTNTEKDNGMTHIVSENFGVSREQTKASKSMAQKLGDWYRTRRQAVKRFVNTPVIQHE